MILAQHKKLMSGLAREYVKSKPDSPEGEFKNSFAKGINDLVKSMDLQDGIDHKNLEQYINSCAPNELPSDIGFLYFAVAYALASELAMIAEDIDQGWMLHAQANFYYGLTAATNRGEEIYTKAIVDVYHGAVSSKGGERRSELLYGEYRTKAFEFLHAQQWKSLNFACKQILVKLAKEFPGKKENGKPLFQDSTVRDWLKGLSKDDLAQWIPSYEAARAKAQAVAGKRNHPADAG